MICNSLLFKLISLIVFVRLFPSMLVILNVCIYNYNIELKLRSNTTNEYIPANALDSICSILLLVRFKLFNL